MSDALFRGSALDTAPSSRAYTADDLRSLARTLDDMPAPTGDQPTEVLLASRTPYGSETFGRLLWWPDGGRWVFTSDEIAASPEDVLPWEPGDGQTWPAGSDEPGARP